MKKIEYCLVLTLMTILFTSCFEDKDNWYTNTKDYDGRYSVAITCDEYSDHDKTIRDGYKLMIYNSATNVENQIIIDSYVAIDADAGTSFHVKGKFDVNGNISGFKASTISANIARSETLNDDEFYVVDDDGNPVEYPSDLPTPTKAGEEYRGMQLYSLVSLDEGKIILKGATTIGGNTSDSIYVAVTTYAEYLTIESYQTPEASWAVSGVPEFDWRIKDGSRTTYEASKEHWKFDGYRYTGFPEDDPSTLPPITEK